MSRKGWLLPDVEDHNGAQYLAIQYCAMLEQPFRLGRQHLLNPGWYVLRTCPCHYRERVTRAYRTSEEAQHARATMLGSTIA